MNKVIVNQSKLRFLGRHVRPMIEQFGLQHFVETGTGIGESIEFALGFPFRSIWSCDVEQFQVERALSVYPKIMEDARVRLTVERSTDMLAKLGEIPADQPVLFWLDAHFPGTYFGRKKFHDEPDPAIRIPLEDELALILKHRPNSRDVILIDDLWFWLGGEFGWGKLPHDLRGLCPVDGIGFIEEMFRETHKIEVHREYSGWLAITPKLLPQSPGTIVYGDPKRPGKRIGLAAKLGLLDQFVRDYMARFDLSVFVETGTGFGQSLVYAQTLPFMALWSCEIDPETLVCARKLFPQMEDDHRTSVVCGESTDMLYRLKGAFGGLEHINILFWLDAHFPGMTLNKEPCGDIPLMAELEMIRQVRPANRDVILIDDLRVWLDGDYEWGPNQPEHQALIPSERGIGFIEDIFARTHDIELHRELGGWLSLTPR